MIEVSNLTKTYGKKRGIDRLSFTIGDGEIVGFLGPNGAGKSTTMNIISGYLSASSGAARIGGIDILEDPVAAKRQIGYLPEQPPLYLDMTVGTTITAQATLSKSLRMTVPGFVRTAGATRRDRMDSFTFRIMMRQ